MYILLKKESHILEGEAYNYSQIAYMGGFRDPNEFSCCFQMYAGCPHIDNRGA